MQKIQTPLTTILSLLVCFGLSTTLLAEEPQATPNTATTTEPPTNTVAENNQDYVIPRPQSARIEALKSSLERRRLSHEIQNLEANGTDFLVLNKASMTDSTQGCVILLHADNEHPDWPDAIAPLRNALPEFSWCTLSMEVPDIIKRGEPIKLATQEEDAQPADSLPNQDEVFARIQATIAQARSENIEQFVLLGYKTGAGYALSFLQQNQTAGMALVLIDIEPTIGISHYDLAQKIRQVAQPTLDYAVQNQAADIQFAAWRKQAANQRTQKNGEYIQLNATPDRVNGNDSKPLLIQRVRGFLKQHTSQITQRKSLPSVNKGLFYTSP
ncbi:MAG: alpha/beta hydrolase family protein [Marinomonas hwangdonensis]|nr:alpha/beta hydrolase family protein [Marinomonas hwangdonensis]